MFRPNASFLILGLGLGGLSFIHGHSSPHRRRLSPDTNIINALHEQIAEGIDHPRFTLTAEYETQGGGLFASLEPFEIDVILTNPSVAETTSFSVDGGPRTSVQSSSKFFIADDIADHDLSKQFAILTVDEEQGLVSGLVQKDGKLLKLEQRLGGHTFVTEASAFDPPDDWKCTVAHDTHTPVARENPPGSDGGHRRVEQSHEHHEHHAHHSHEDGHSHHVHTLNLNEADSIFSQVSNIDPNMLHGRRRLYQTDDFPLKWSYQVDLYIEIDQTLVNKHDPTDQVNMPNTINYVNALITAASSVYEKEVDTHLHVLHISKTTIYDGQTSTSGALNVMMNQYSNANAWHYTDSVTGETPDLHHAILGRSLGGGVAYKSTICNSQYGFGVSAGIQGSMQDIGGEMFWDLTVIMHELGHNFGSDHTHDLDGYNPKVDACGDGQCTSLIDGGTLQSGEATIMSYCHLCPGGETNIGATFGGHWNGGDRSNINNWVNNDLVKGWSQDARRVSKTMYQHVSSRNSCVEPYLPVPAQFCSIDAECDTGNSCMIGKCDTISGTCSVEIKDGCCGNGKCEAGENGSNCSDCAPTTLPTPTCSSCWIPYSAMFDIEAINDIDITSISFRIYGGISTIKVYTAPQSYTNIATNSNAWTLVASGSVAVSNWANIKADIADIPLSAGSKRAFYIVASGQLAIAEDSSTPLAADSNVKLLNPTRVSFSTTKFGSASSGVYSWVGSITYTPRGAAAPVTSSPSNKPTPSPTKKPTNSPSRKPTLSPTKKPTPVPTAKPTNNPSKAPVTSKPTIAPSKKPTALPTAKPTSLSPITASPVSSPSGGGAQDAIFDSGFAVPRCKSTGTSCSSGDLLNGRSNISGGPEPGQPNTLDGCADGSYGSYHNDESIDKILVRSGEKDGTGSGVTMEEGGRATIIASIWAWESGASDTADFYYTADASNPVWQYIGSETPEGGGAQDLMVSYDLPQGPNQAVRVQFRYSGSIGTCTLGSYNDRDDIVFAVVKGPSRPTQAPVKTQPPTEATGGGPQQASYDTSLSTARCSVYGSECDSLELLNGRGTMQNGNEPNRPNTIDSCTEGNLGSYHYDESIDRIVVRSGEEDGTGSGVNMVEGGRATIIASVWPWFSGSSDYADFYYTQNSANPQWVYIGTKQPTGSGLQEIKMSYTLPQGISQAVRVNFRYRGLQGANGACSNGSYDDTDDLAFAVKSSPSFIGLVAETAVTEEEPKDITVDAMKRNELTANKLGRRGGSKSSKNAKRA